MRVKTKLRLGQIVYYNRLDRAEGIHILTPFKVRSVKVTQSKDDWNRTITDISYRVVSQDNYYASIVIDEDEHFNNCWFTDKSKAEVKLKELNKYYNK